MTLHGARMRRPTSKASFGLALLLTVGGCGVLWPGNDVVVHLPIEEAVAHVETWSDLGEGRLMLKVSTRRGSLRTDLWRDWGPAQRVSLYLTPEGWLVALGGGGTAIMVDLKSPGGPREVMWPERPGDSDHT
jgi:hypothetical protein